MCVCVCVCMCVYVIVSSSYPLMFGDYRVRGTLKQMMLQVDLVRHRAGARLVWKKSFIRVFKFYVLNEL